MSFSLPVEKLRELADQIQLERDNEVRRSLVVLSGREIKDLIYDSKGKHSPDEVALLYGRLLAIKNIFLVASENSLLPVPGADDVREDLNSLFERLQEMRGAIGPVEAGDKCGQCGQKLRNRGAQ